ncbi:DUF6942 family protein [Marinobacterium lutimaris]|nr:hypothetical protein [Marinobacterium lutimaris]
MTSPKLQRLGSANPRLCVYIPHLPEALEACAASGDVATLLAHNSNHWRKIVTLSAKIASPDDDWRTFRDQQFFRQVALVFSASIEVGACWHWIGGKDNQARFGLDSADWAPLAGTDDLFIDAERKLLLTPYPDYRQLSNQKVELIRQALQQLGFYGVR